MIKQMSVEDAIEYIHKQFFARDKTTIIYVLGENHLNCDRGIYTASDCLRLSEAFRVIGEKLKEDV